MSDNDFMEIGDSGLVPQKDGWFYNKNTDEMIDPDGRVWDIEGELVHDPKWDEE